MKKVILTFCSLVVLCLNINAQTLPLLVINNTSDQLSVTGIVADNCNQSTAQTSSGVLVSSGTAVQINSVVAPPTSYEWAGIAGYINPLAVPAGGTFQSQRTPAPACTFVVFSGPYSYTWYTTATHVVVEID